MSGRPSAQAGQLPNPAVQRRTSGGGVAVPGRSTDLPSLPASPAMYDESKRGRSVQRSEHEELIQAHRAWMETAEAKAVYRLRGQTIEIVFADVKEHRGLRRFSGHGLARVRTEFALEILLHNLLVLHRFLSQRQNTEAMPYTITLGVKSHEITNLPSP